MKLLKAMATVAGFTLLSRVAGFLRDILIAAFMGAGPVADAFFIALKLPALFRRMTAEGALSVSFVPIYAGKLETETDQEAAKFAGRVFTLLLCILIPFVFLMMLAMPVVIFLLAPGFETNGPRYALAIELSYITFPYLLLVSLAALIGGMLNAHGRYGPFALAPLLFNLSLMASLPLLSDILDTPGHALAWGVLAAGFLQLGYVWFALNRAGIKIEYRAPNLKHPDIKRLLKAMGPGIIGAGVMQLNIFADMIIASFLSGGAISYLYYADRLNQLPLGVVGIAAGTALLPMLSKAIAAGHASEANHLYNRALEILSLLAIPSALGLCILAEPIMTVLFVRGEFRIEDAAATAFVLQCYTIGLPAYVAGKVFSTVYWAKSDTATPVKFSVFAAIVNIICGIVLSQIMGVAGIALATATAGWVQLSLFLYSLKGREEVKSDARLIRSLKSIGLACLVMAGLLVAGGYISQPLAEYQTLRLMGMIALGGAGYGLTLILTGGLSLADIRSLILRKK